MSWTASHLAGPILSGSLYTQHPRLPSSPERPSPCSAFWSSLPRSVIQPAQRRLEAETLDVEDSTWKRKFLYAIWIGNFVSWFLLGNVRYQFPKLARALAIDPQRIGLLIGCLGLAQFVGFSLLRQTDRWHYPPALFRGCPASGATGMLLLLSSSAQLMFAVAFFVIGLCASLTYKLQACITQSIW